MIAALSKVIKRMHYPLAVMLTCVCWYVAYPLNLRQMEEMMAERGICVDHATVHRWAIRIVPVLAAVFFRRKRPVGKIWRMDETYIKVHGQWKYLYRAVDRDGEPQKITIDKGGANTATIQSYNAEHHSDIELHRAFTDAQFLIATEPLSSAGKLPSATGATRFQTGIPLTSCSSIPCWVFKRTMLFRSSI